MSERKTTTVITRREVLKRTLFGAAGASFFQPSALWAQTVGKPARAKSVIQIWMWGGPAHLDTFDPKPDAGYDYCGPLNKAIPTNVDGIQVGELLPLLAQQADKYAIVRSMTHGVNAHETASYITQTGRKPGRLLYPCAGAVVFRFKGYDSGYTEKIPPYIVLTTPQGRFSEAGFLGQRYKPFATGGDPNQRTFVVEGIVAQGISDRRQRDRRELLHTLDSLGKAMPENPHFERLDRCEENAYDLMFGDTRQLFDLSEEKEPLRDRYGRNTFGQSCLMARRLVERGVPYVTLTDRGLLDSTIVWWSGEFGRSPRVKWDSPWNGGRSHYGKCFSAVVAGGGFKGGAVVGASDATGEEVAERPVYPCDLIGSMYAQLGIDPEGPLPNQRGLDVRVMPSSEDGVQSGGRLTEII